MIFPELFPNSARINFFRIKAVIFDMDGVLVDTMAYHAEAWVQAFKETGVKIERKDIFEIEGSNHTGIVNEILKKKKVNINLNADDLAKRKIEIFNRISEIKVFDHVVDILKYLKHKGYLLAVVSGSNKKTVHDIMNSLFPDIFDVIISGDDVSQSKPSPEPYIKAVDRLGVPKEEAIIIENSVFGVRSAKRAGVTCIGIPTYVNKDSLKDADIVVADHYQLKLFIESHL